MTNAQLHPDIVQAGGLASALQNVLDQLGASLRVGELGEPRFIAYANVRSGQRSSQVMLAAEERAFSVDFWNQGVVYGHGGVGDLRQAALAIVRFQEGLASVEMMAAEFPWFERSRSVEIHERGPEPFVTDAWQGLVEWLGTSEPVGSPMRRLLPLFIEAARRPDLRQLLPFTSMDTLCFSRTTGYPYTADCPTAQPVAEDRFRVLGCGGTLAEGCGPARHGTAED